MSNDLPPILLGEEHSNASEEETVRPNWRQSLTERQNKLVDHARAYASDPFGVEGHNALLTIAKMAELLDAAESGRVRIGELFVTIRPDGQEALESTVERGVLRALQRG